MNCRPLFRTAPLWLTCLLAGTSWLFADDDPARWEKDIARFEQQEAEHPVPANGVLFVGSSSIRMWDTQQSFPEAQVINRGFGGSQISDVAHFLDRLVLKHKPRTIVFYAGDNDVAAGESADQVVRDFQALAGRVQQELPGTHLVYLPIKPSLKRWNLWATMSDANRRIRRWMVRDYRLHYADTATPLLGEDGKPNEALFLKDGLHLNEQGYALWTPIVQHYLQTIDAARDLPLARGVVFEDANRNQRRDGGERGLPEVRVSNGRQVVATDSEGAYQLPVDEDDAVFVIKPPGYRTPLDEQHLPRFYYLHKPAGSPTLKFPGVPPTGPLPASIDFPLYPQREPQQFQAILFGDPQPRDQQEVDYVAHDVVEELLGTKASFGVTLGDIMFDDLSLFEAQNKVIALLGIPWYNVIGNHDLNFDAANDQQSDESFERVFGPSYYSFDYGTVHFLVLDDVQWLVDEPGKRGKYRGGLGPEQLDFIRHDLQAIPDDQLVVLMMHIPLVDVHDRQDLYRLIERRPFCMSIAGHTHLHEHRYIKREDGLRGPEPHHHVINVTVSGSWWGGAPDERGIPHTMMADGAPNGYSIITFDGQKYRLDFKAAGRPADYQMQIHAPDEVTAGQTPTSAIYVNVFNGSEKSKVEMQLDPDGPWLPMRRVAEMDPGYMQIVKTESSLEGKTWRNLPLPKLSTHLWKAVLPADLASGLHLLRVRTIDRHGREYQSGRALRVRKPALAARPLGTEAKD